jgi:hypothetical protein
MSIKKIVLLCFLLLWIALPVYAHDAEAHSSDIEKLISGIGVLILAVSLLSLLFKKDPSE